MFYEATENGTSQRIIREEDQNSGTYACDVVIHPKRLIQDEKLSERIGMVQALDFGDHVEISAFTAENGFCPAGYNQSDVRLYDSINESKTTLIEGSFAQASPQVLERLQEQSATLHDLLHDNLSWNYIASACNHHATGRFSVVERASNGSQAQVIELVHNKTYFFSVKTPHQKVVGVVRNVPNARALASKLAHNYACIN